jgi:serine/threonine protein kinase
MCRNGEETHNMILPLAHGNLAQLFDAKLDDLQGGSGVEALWSQFHGLVHALAHLHDQLEVVHTDLRSSNILIFVTDSFPRVLLKIADFGYSFPIIDFFRNDRWTPSHLRSGMPSVRERLSNDERLSRSDLCINDMWSLGCIFTELATYLVGGSRLLIRFRNYRTIKTAEYTTNSFCLKLLFKMNPHVFTWLHDLSERDSTNRVKQLPLATMLHTETGIPARDLAKGLAKVGSHCTPS